MIVDDNHTHCVIGSCAPPEAGYRIGRSGYKYAQLQVHWTNDLKESNLYDSSGMKIYYTPTMRKYDLGTITTGQLHLELPPFQKEVCCRLIPSIFKLFARAFFAFFCRK